MIYTLEMGKVHVVGDHEVLTCLLALLFWVRAAQCLTWVLQTTHVLCNLMVLDGTGVAAEAKRPSCSASVVLVRLQPEASSPGKAMTKSSHLVFEHLL